MGILNWFRRNKKQLGKPVEHAVIVHFKYGSTDLGALFDLQSRLEEAVDDARVGEVDGHEVATDGSDGFVYLYGPDADALFAAIRPILAEADFMKGARVKLRYGPPDDGVKEHEVVLGA